jgi:hypothetical protein
MPTYAKHYTVFTFQDGSATTTILPNDWARWGW